MNSIRKRLALILGIVAAAALAAGGGSVFVLTKKILGDSFDHTLLAKSNALLTASEIDDGKFEIDLTIQDFEGFGTGGNDYFTVHDANGALLIISPSLADAPPGILPRPAAHPLGSVVAGTLGDGRTARIFQTVFNPKDDLEKQYENLTLTVASPDEQLAGDLNVLGRVILGVGAFLIVTIPPLTFLVASRALRPVKLLGGQVTAISVEKIDTRIARDEQPDELKPLVTSLNGWLDRLAASVGRERRFTSHAAHELRTPLAELRMNAELGASWPDQSTPELCAEIVGIADEMGALLDKLSLLAKADDGGAMVSWQAFDHETALRSLVEKFRAGADEKQHDIRVTASPGECVVDPAVWEIIARNLIGNAVSHAPRGSVIQAHAAPNGLRVSNSAPDLSPADLPHLSERFWRKKPVHSEERHSGLGLSIADASARSLGGALHAVLDDQGILHMEARWQSPGASCQSR